MLLYSFGGVMLSSLFLFLEWLNLFLGICGVICYFFSPVMAFIFGLCLPVWLSGVSALSVTTQRHVLGVVRGLCSMFQGWGVSKMTPKLDMVNLLLLIYLFIFYQMWGFYSSVGIVSPSPSYPSRPMSGCWPQWVQYSPTLPQEPQKGPVQSSVWEWIPQQWPSQRIKEPPTVTT